MTMFDHGGHSEAHTEAWANMYNNFWPVYKMDLMIWPFIQLINFAFVPPHLQASVVALCSVGWGGYLSWVNDQ